jgi:hypothetical protein
MKWLELTGSLVLASIGFNQLAARPSNFQAILGAAESIGLFLFLGSKQ